MNQFSVISKHVQSKYKYSQTQIMSYQVKTILLKYYGRYIMETLIKNINNNIFFA